MNNILKSICLLGLLAGSTLALTPEEKLGISSLVIDVKSFVYNESIANWAQESSFFLLFLYLGSMFYGFAMLFELHRHPLNASNLRNLGLRVTRYSLSTPSQGRTGLSLC